MGTDAPLVDISEDEIVEFETVVLPIPQFDTENPEMISQGPSICIFNKEDPQEVLASWLFAQYLLTNDVQIAYSQTEGYVPVTERAQNDPEYLDYLSRGGEDDDVHYQVKIDACELLIDNIDNTFVTPVFNGSASLRNAAGQLIENTVKSCRRSEEINEEYMTALYADVESLYRLDQIESSQSGNKDLGPLPMEAKILLISLAIIWIMIIIYCLALYKREKTRKKY